MEEAIYLGDRIFRMESNPGRLVEILEAPRPDIPPEEMRKKKWFSEMVAELLNRVESGSDSKGSLISSVTEQDQEEKLELFRLMG